MDESKRENLLLKDTARDLTVYLVQSGWNPQVLKGLFLV
jgi:hypothetical protein